MPSVADGVAAAPTPFAGRVGRTVHVLRITLAAASCASSAVARRRRTPFLRIHHFLLLAFHTRIMIRSTTGNHTLMRYKRTYECTIPTA